MSFSSNFIEISSFFLEISFFPFIEVESCWVADDLNNLLEKVCLESLSKEVFVFLLFCSSSSFIFLPL